MKFPDSRVIAKIIVSLGIVVTFVYIVIDQHEHVKSGSPMDIWHYVYTAFINLVLVYLLVDTWRSHRSTLDKLKDFKPEQPPNVVKMARAHSTEVTRREPVPVSKRWTRITVSMLLVTMIGGLSYMYYTFTEFIDMDGVVLTGVLIAGVDLVLIVLLTSMWRR